MVIKSIPKGEKYGKKIREISDRVTRMTQEKLGGSYHTIYDYASDHLDYKVQTELLLLFDFSAAMVGDVMADVLNIMKNGAKCGVLHVHDFRRKSTGKQSDNVGKRYG